MKENFRASGTRMLRAAACQRRNMLYESLVLVSSSSRASTMCMLGQERHLDAEGVATPQAR